MKRLVFSYAILMSILLTSCKTTDQNSSSDKSGQESKGIPVQPVVVDRDFSSENSITEIQITAAVLKDSILTLSVSYTGCKDDVAELVFNGSYLKSLPPKAQLFFRLKKGNSGCSKSYVKDFSYNLAPIKNTGSKTLIIMLPGFQENQTYQY
jgi:hypothetical protein